MNLGYQLIHNHEAVEWKGRSWSGAVYLLGMGPSLDDFKLEIPTDALVVTMNATAALYPNATWWCFSDERAIRAYHGKIDIKLTCPVTRRKERSFLRQYGFEPGSIIVEQIIERTQEWVGTNSDLFLFCYALWLRWKGVKFYPVGFDFTSIIYDDPALRTVEHHYAERLGSVLLPFQKCMYRRRSWGDGERTPIKTTPHQIQLRQVAMLFQGDAAFGKSFNWKHNWLDLSRLNPYADDLGWESSLRVPLAT